jgi:hypothetical protein
MRLPLLEEDEVQPEIVLIFKLPGNSLPRGGGGEEIGLDVCDQHVQTPQRVPRVAPIHESRQPPEGGHDPLRGEVGKEQLVGAPVAIGGLDRDGVKNTPAATPMPMSTSSSSTSAM